MNVLPLSSLNANTTYVSSTKQLKKGFRKQNTSNITPKKKKRK
jgi:hypothetical protein